MKERETCIILKLNDILQNVPIVAEGYRGMLGNGTLSARKRNTCSWHIASQMSAIPFGMDTIGVEFVGSKRNNLDHPTQEQVPSER